MPRSRLPSLAWAAVLLTLPACNALAAGTETFLYAFPNANLAGPAGPLSAVGTTLYGEAQDNGRQEDGGIFEVTSAGAVKTAIKFAVTPEAAPVGGFTSYNGIFYGATIQGGDACGTVFSVSATGVVTTLYVFHNGSNSADGCAPTAPPVVVNGVLYGTTEGGGTVGGGTIYSLTLSGTETVLHNFVSAPSGNSGASDGTSPQGKLLAIGSTLYGVTAGGGGSTLCYPGCGTVFSSDLLGNETVLHGFAQSDGATPTAPLLNVDGTLYGVAGKGGASGCGTAFTYTPGPASFAVVHQFAGAPADACFPMGGLTLFNGTLYGPANGPTSGPGAAVIYAMTREGETSIDYSFGAGSANILPQGPLLVQGGALWGTAFYGGTARYGSIFAITP